MSYLIYIYILNNFIEMSDYIRKMISKRTIILSDHQHKYETFVQFIVDKLATKYKYFFLICSKHYQYHNVKWYTPYENITDFEFKITDIDKLLEIIKNIHSKILVIFDLGNYSFHQYRKILPQLDNFFTKQITLILCASCFSTYEISDYLTDTPQTLVWGFFDHL